MDGEKSFNNVQDRHDFFKILKLGIKKSPGEGREEELGRQEGGEIIIGMQKKK